MGAGEAVNADELFSAMRVAMATVQPARIACLPFPIIHAKTRVRAEHARVWHANTSIRDTPGHRRTVAYFVRQAAAEICAECTDVDAKRVQLALRDGVEHLPADAPELVRARVERWRNGAKASGLVRR